MQEGGQGPPPFKLYNPKAEGREKSREEQQPQAQQQEGGSERGGQRGGRGRGRGGDARPPPPPDPQEAKGRGAGRGRGRTRGLPVDQVPLGGPTPPPPASAQPAETGAASVPSASSQQPPLQVNKDRVRGTPEGKSRTVHRPARVLLCPWQVKQTLMTKLSEREAEQAQLRAERGRGRRRRRFDDYVDDPNTMTLEGRPRRGCPTAGGCCCDPFPPFLALTAAEYEAARRGGLSNAATRPMTAPAPGATHPKTQEELDHELALRLQHELDLEESQGANDPVAAIRMSLFSSSRHEEEQDGGGRGRGRYGRGGRGRGRGRFH